MHRHGPGGPAGFKSAVSAVPTTPRESGADERTCTSRGLRPPASRAGAFAVSPHPHEKWIRHGDSRSALPHTRGMRRCLRFAGMKVGRSGRTCTCVARGAARLQRAAIAALPRFEIGGSGGIGSRSSRSARWAPPPAARSRCCAPAPNSVSEIDSGLEQELHLRPSPYEGAALTAAPPSRGGSPRYCPGFCRVRTGGFTIKACDPKSGPDGGTCTPDHSRPKRACSLLHYVRMVVDPGVAPGDACVSGR